MGKRLINMRVLPSEPLDGTGLVCIHLFVPDSTGPFVEPHALHPVIDDDGNIVKQKVRAKPTRGRLACDPKRTVAPVTNKRVTTLTLRTADARAVTCPWCKVSSEYIAAMKE